MAQFKVGDRVSIYGFHAQDAGIVLKRSIAEMGTDGLLLTDAGEYVHPNQCRRLVKKKRPIIYVRGEGLEFNDEFSRGEVVKVEVANHYARRGSHWIKYIKAKKQD